MLDLFLGMVGNFFFHTLNKGKNKHWLEYTNQHVFSTSFFSKVLPSASYGSVGRQTTHIYVGVFVELAAVGMHTSKGGANF